MEQYFGVALAVAILYVAYKYYEKRKNKAGRGAGLGGTEGNTKEK